MLCAVRVELHSRRRVSLARSLWKSGGRRTLSYRTSPPSRWQPKHLPERKTLCFRGSNIYTTEHETENNRLVRKRFCGLWRLFVETHGHSITWVRKDGGDIPTLGQNDFLEELHVCVFTVSVSNQRNNRTIGGIQIGNSVSPRGLQICQCGRRQKSMGSD